MELQLGNHKKSREPQNEGLLLNAFPAIFDSFLIKPNFILLIGQDGIVKHYYQEKCNYEWGQEKVTEKNIYKLLGLGTAKILLSAQKKARYTQKAVPFDVCFKIDNLDYYFNGSVHPAKESNDYIIVANDLTEKKRQEHELAEKTQALTDFSGYLKQLHRIQTTYYVNMGAMFTDYLKTGCRMFKISTGIIGKVSGRMFIVKSIQSDIESADKFLDTKVTDAFADEVVRQRATLFFDNNTKAGLTSFLDNNFYMFIGTPILVDNEVYGVLSFYSSEERNKPIQAYEIEIIELMARGIGKYLEERINVVKKEKIKNILKESEEKYRTVIENLSEVIFKTDTYGNIIFLNPAWEDMFGYPATDSRGKKLSVYVLPEDVALHESQINALLNQKQGFATYEVRCRTKDGSCKWIAINIKYNIEYGKFTGIVGTLNDITEKKQAELDLQKSEQRYRSLLDATFEGIIVHNNSHILDLNQSFAMMLLYNVEELIGTSFLDLVVTEEERSIIVNKLAKRDDATFESRALRKDGTIIDLEINSKKHTYHGNVVLLSAVRDITARKKAEKELIHARILAEESVRAKEQFLSIMSHELRTPLNTVVGMTHLLLDEDPKQEQVEYLKAVKFSADNLLALINDILDFSKIESGKVTFEQIDFNLRDLLKGIRQSLILKAEEKNLQIHVNMDIEVPEVVKGDVTRLNQILTNLLSNAIKFTDQGSVSISVTTKKETKETVSLYFEIKDTGIGIPEDKLNAIFESYQQASSDITRRFGGTGLGLTITKQLVELQGGQIAVKSKIGEGSVFAFTLTFGKCHEVYQSSKQNEFQYKSLNHIQVLVVEDNKFNQMVISKFLKKWDVQYDIADGGQEALDMLKTKYYDLILMDLQMPGMSGVEATKHIRSNPQKTINSLPIIALTASSLADVKAKVQEAGMDDFVTKPFNPGELYLKIERYANKSQQANAENMFQELVIKSTGDNIADFSYLEMLSDDNEEFIVQALEMFVQQMSDYTKVLEEVASTKNVEVYRFHTHKMKSAYNTLQINVFKDIVRNSDESNEFENFTFEMIESKLSLLLKLNQKVFKEVEAKLSELKG